MMNKYDEAREKIKGIFNGAREYSNKASEIGRQLAFGEGAILWFFFDKIHQLNSLILVGYSFLVLYFVFDLSQYIIGALLNKTVAAVYEELN